MRQPSLASLLLLSVSVLIVDKSYGFAPTTPPTRRNDLALTVALSIDQKEARVGDLLGDLPTPSLLLELSLMEKFLKESKADCSIDEFLSSPTEIAKSSTILLDKYSPLFIHTRVTSTAKRDAVVAEQGSGKSLSVCNVDASMDLVGEGGAYLGLGLANHHVGGYYWARSMGIGASLPAHGIHFGPSSDNNSKDGELYWKKRGPGNDPAETTEQSSNSNDGKRSEWADFLTVGDTVQLVPKDILSVLESSPFPLLLGIRRTGRPLGADPIVERIWKRSSGTSGAWESQ